ncbi:MAG TPA: asparagine synthase (glutamine-hydrolyzing) [Gemmatimonadaceae bacterium]|nr:asparagine synthase (glutamine-hydrolyzing) [Gemmatimonadaceae bacterium]
MCGIAGWFGAEPSCQAERLLESVRHRGPDGEGTWEDPSQRAALIHARLSILDLSELGAQPMSCGGAAGDASGSRMVMNGEIFNFRDLRQELEAKGETFIGSSDTEVVIRLLSLEGKLALPKLAGMFALAWYDTTTGHGLLARDPFGIKPLYYTEVGGAIAFASEVKALLPLVPHARATSSAVRDTLLWGSMSGPRTFFDPIRELPAGSYLEWDGSSATVRRWYQLRFNAAPAPRDPVRQARDALVESMQRHLVSDVPVGIFLSGGVDSTAILALARQVLGPDADVRTFSIGFADPKYDESSVARRTAAHFGARHTEWIMTSSEGQSEIGGYLDAMDQPTIDGFNTWCVSKLARREGMKVVLSGLGGDELFGGYDSFRRVPQYLGLYHAVGTLRPYVAGALDRNAPGSRWRRLAAFLRGSGSPLSAYHVQRGIFTEDEARTLALSVTGTDPGPASWHADELPQNPADAVSQLELTRYMLNQLLRDSDVFGMAHGLELRVPFVDARLFESVAMIPASVRLERGKKMLLQAVPEIPAWVREQPKRGFRFPLQDWIESGLSDVLDVANEAATVPLVTWYRRWALATVLLRRAAAAQSDYERLTISGGSFRKAVRTAS